MKICLMVVGITLLTSMLFAAPGEIIGSGFTFGMVRGLDKDWGDGNIWMTTAVSNNCQIGKFDAVTHEQIGDWVTASGQYWCFDCGYGYVYNGTTSIILLDQNTSGGTRMKCYNPSTGAYLGSLPNAFPEYQYDDGLGVQAGPLAPLGNNLWATSYSGNPVKMSNYPCTTWSSFVTCPGTPAMGVAYFSGFTYRDVLVATTSPDYKIYCFFAFNGYLYDTWSLRDWPSNRYILGLAAGRSNAVGFHESLFIATFGASNMIYEVEIGNLDIPMNVQPASVGLIKSVYH
jgi:hypothetical protein